MRQAAIETTGTTGQNAGGASGALVGQVIPALPAIGVRRVADLEELAHDARNLMTALGLYCDLLEEPGVLTASYRHYGGELRLVAEASQKLVQRMVGQAHSHTAAPSPARLDEKLGRLHVSEKIEDLRDELMASRNLLAAISGQGIVVCVKAAGGAVAVNLDSEDLTRILVNLVKNAAEAMPATGRVEIRLTELPKQAGTVPSVELTVDDDGPGLGEEICERVFEAGVTSRGGSGARVQQEGTGRGIGLSIVRSIVESAGGRIEARRSELGGACFRMEFPVISH